MDGLQAVRYTRGRLLVLDQLRLPHEYEYDEVQTSEEAFDTIRSMRVRGAPAIAIVATLALAVELVNQDFSSATVVSQQDYINQKLDYLKGSRPTAVDLTNAISLLKQVIAHAGQSSTEAATVREAYIKAAEKIFQDDLTTNLAIGRYGAEYLRRQQSPFDIVDEVGCFTTSSSGERIALEKDDRKMSVLTHCNTGALATSGHGTALGIIRTLHNMDYLEHAFCTETRPYNQGSRLTAFELVYENIPATLITDSMAGALFAQRKEEKNISAVIVGADRVARNGDTANKIGTYGLAVLANHHGIKFIVAAPTTSIDLETASGEDIQIEFRARHELTQISGAVVEADGMVNTSKKARVAIAEQRIDVWNPAFDVTPYRLIDAIITEKGEVVRSKTGTFDFEAIMPERWTGQVEKEAHERI
ncbi:Methylthioribose-1-phosphate isomerase [Lentinula aff. detonsa]|nr:Methylthioribose-1-phosphate isomerase [Lentinula aff. detonsa]